MVSLVLDCVRDFVFFGFSFVVCLNYFFGFGFLIGFFFVLFLWFLCFFWFLWFRWFWFSSGSLLFVGFGFFLCFSFFSLVGFWFRFLWTPWTLDFLGLSSVFTKPYLRHGKHALDCDHFIAFCVCFFWAGWDPLRDFACFRFDSLMLVSDFFLWFPWFAFPPGFWVFGSGAERGRRGPLILAPVTSKCLSPFVRI